MAKRNLPFGKPPNRRGDGPTPGQPQSISDAIIQGIAPEIRSTYRDFVAAGNQPNAVVVVGVIDQKHSSFNLAMIQARTEEAVPGSIPAAMRGMTRADVLTQLVPRFPF